MRTSGLILAALLASSLFAAGHNLTAVPPNANQLLPAVTGNGSGFLAAWIEQAYRRDAVVSSVVNTKGEPIEGGSTAVDQTSFSSSIAIAHRQYDAIVVWTTADGNLYAERLSPSGVALGTTLVASGKDYLTNVAVAWNGSRYFVVWTNGPQLFGAFIAPDGSSTTPHAFFVAHDDGYDSYFALDPRVVWNGRHFMVVFRRQRVVPCATECPYAPRDPDQIRVMRLSAEGNPIDSVPLVIKGNHMRARVASSGAESLITLDGFGERVAELSTIVVHDGETLKFDPETPLFRWQSEVFSEVVWDGATYTVGWSYSQLPYHPSWIGAAHVTRSGLALDYRFAPAGILFPAEWNWEWPLAPSMGANDDGDTALVLAETATASSSSLARVRLYLVSELAAMPPAPAPRNVAATFSGGIARIDWQSDPALEFTIEQFSNRDQQWYVAASTSGDARSTYVSAVVGDLFRIRGLGLGGASEGTIVSIASVPRRRAATNHP